MFGLQNVVDETIFFLRLALYNLLVITRAND